MFNPFHRYTSHLKRRITAGGDGYDHSPQPTAKVITLPTSESITEAFKRDLRNEFEREFRLWYSSGAHINEFYDRMVDITVDLIMDFEPTKPEAAREKRDRT